jgi:hypothetical protein
MAAALAAYLKLGDSATYIGCTYKDRPEIPDGATVYFVDYSWPRVELEALAARCAVIVIDHHESAMKDLAGLGNNLVEGAHPAIGPNTTGLFLYLDGNRSGCVLSWCFFQPDKPLPMMYALIQDRDLWRWVHGDVSKDFSYYLRSQELSLEVYRGILVVSTDDSVFERMLEHGSILRTADENTVNLLLQYAHPATFADGSRVMAVNSSVLPSELGEALCDKYPDAPFGAVYYRTEDGRIKWSLRSRGDFDVSALSKKYGGGGHKAAAGFYSTPQVAAKILGDGGLRFEHYRNGLTYEKLAEGTANDVIDHGADVVVYRAEGTGNVYVRTADNFNGPAIVGEFPGWPVPRFKPL